MRFLALALVAVLLQGKNCDQIPAGDVEYKDCAVEDQREGYSCKALFVGGQLVRKVYTENTKPSPSPTVLPSASPSTSPSSDPTPIPSPSTNPPSPSPPAPSPSPIDQACVVQPDGFYPTPAIDECPKCWRDSLDVIGYWGIAKGGTRKCTGANCGCGIVFNAHITPHSTDDKFLRHRYDFEKKQFSGTETHKGCQPPEIGPGSEEIPDIWVYPPNDTAGECDALSSSRYWCHHKAKAGTCGKTKFEVHAPPFKSITVDIP